MKNDVTLFKVIRLHSEIKTMDKRDFVVEIQKHTPKMKALALAILKNEDLVKDGLQEVAIKLWNQLDYFTKVTNKEAYCMRIIKNWCFDQLQLKANNHLRLVYSKVTDNQEESETENDVDKRYKTIESLVEELPDKQRIIIELKDFKGFDFEEIAELLEMEQGSVRVNLSRARKRLKKMYEEIEYNKKIIHDEKSN